jgi:hypothetical protein
MRTLISLLAVLFLSSVALADEPPYDETKAEIDEWQLLRRFDLRLPGYRSVSVEDFRRKFVVMFSGEPIQALNKRYLSKTAPVQARVYHSRNSRYGDVMLILERDVDSDLIRIASVSATLPRDPFLVPRHGKDNRENYAVVDSSGGLKGFMRLMKVVMPDKEKKKDKDDPRVAFTVKEELDEVSP